MALNYWREAATLIIIGLNKKKFQYNVSTGGILFDQHGLGKSPTKKPKTMNANYEILCLKRSSRSSFMPDTFVFPGGALDQADTSTKWIELFKAYGYKQQDLYEIFRFQAERPYIYQNKPPSQLLPELAFRICALRETFEETGLLLSTTAENFTTKFFPTVTSLKDDEREEWRLKVHNDANQFINLYKHIGNLPCLWNLHDWMTWLTPTVYGEKNKRFDTVFYITFLDLEIPGLTHCRGEAEELQTYHPYELLQKHFGRNILLAPPQLYEISRFLNFEDINEFRNFAEKLSKKGMSRWMPVRVNTQDAALTICPGDDMYPEDPNYTGVNEDVVMISQTAEDFRKQFANVNRFELRQSKPSMLYCNIKLEYDHVTPVSYSSVSDR